MAINHSLTKGLSIINNAIYGALGSELILDVLAQYGYTREVIETEGVVKYNLAESLSIKMTKEYGDQYSASEKSNELFNTFQPAYMDVVRLVRIGLKDMPGALHSLRATGSRNRSLSGFIKDARTFYTNLLDQPEYLDTVRRFGINEEKIQSALNDIDTLEAAYHKFLKEKGEAQTSTIARDQAYDDLYRWYSDFRAVARLALKNYPQYIEKMGIVVKR